MPEMYKDKWDELRKTIALEIDVLQSNLYRVPIMYQISEQRFMEMYIENQIHALQKVLSWMDK